MFKEVQGMADKTPSVNNYLSLKTASRRLDLNPKTLRLMIHRGELRHILLHGRYRISERDLIALMENAARGGARASA